MKKLTILYDAECALCRRCRAFLSAQPAYFALEFVPLQTPDLEERFPGISRLQPEREILAISDEGGVYPGGAAWVMCLYALREYREWSFRLASPLWLPLAKNVVASVSRHRSFLSRFFRSEQPDPAQLRPACACA